MSWFQIVLIIYFGINLIIAIIATIVFEGLGYFHYAPPNWGKAALVFIVLMIIGLPVAIIGSIEWLLSRK